MTPRTPFNTPIQRPLSTSESQTQRCRERSYYERDLVRMNGLLDRRKSSLQTDTPLRNPSKLSYDLRIAMQARAMFTEIMTVCYNRPTFLFPNAAEKFRTMCEIPMNLMYCLMSHFRWIPYSHMGNLHADDMNFSTSNTTHLYLHFLLHADSTRFDATLLDQTYEFLVSYFYPYVFRTLSH